MEIKLNNLNYNFDNDGNTEGITTGFTGSGDRCSVSASIYIEQTDLPEDKTFDDMSKNDLTKIGRDKFASMTANVTEDDKPIETVVTDNTKAEG